jgi:hypothetical protein
MIKTFQVGTYCSSSTDGTELNFRDSHSDLVACRTRDTTLVTKAEQKKKKVKE